MREHDTKTTSVFLAADGEASSLVFLLSDNTVNQGLFLSMSCSFTPTFLSSSGIAASTTG